MNTAKRISILAAAFAVSCFAQPAYDTVLKNLKFRSIGPATMGGRLDDIAVVESDPRIIYIGAAGGGLFKTVNGGITWKALFEDQSNPSIGAIAIAPSNPSIIYVGTGEANNRQSSSWGNGVYKSTDGGTTWKNIGLVDTHHIGRIVVDPKDPNIAFVAALGDLWGPNVQRGVFRTTDGGATWFQTLAIDADTGASDVAIDSQSPNIIYATAYERRRTVFGYSGGGPKSGLYRSTDSGMRWTKMTKGLPPTGDIGRCALSVYRKNTNIVYALVEHRTLGGVYRSEDKGESWTRMGDTNPRPSYFSQIRVDPNNDLKIWLGGVNIYMSEDGGKNFVQTRFNRVHSDNHAIWIDPANSDHLLSGNDGGIWVTEDSGRNWRHLNNIALGQFYEVAFDYQKPYHVCGGLQDNYSWCGPSSSTQQDGIGNEDWMTVQGGDGFYNRIDPTDSNIIYAESQDGNLSRRDLRTSESKSIRPLEDNDQAPRYRFQWNSPMMISPHDPKTIYYGGNHLFKSTDRGDTWERLGEDLTTGAVRDKQMILGKLVDQNTLSRNDGVVAWPCITAIAESPVKAGVLWVGTDDGNVQMSRNGGKTWTNVVGTMRGIAKGGYVSRIEPSYKEEATAYITFDDHRSADYGVYILMTKNYGDSFTLLDRGIPPDAGTVHVIREDPANPNLLFAGTEFGMFISFDRGANWHRMKNGLPTVPVFDIQIHPRDHDLILATHGRSIWIMDNISALEQIDSQTLSTDLKLFDSRPAIEWKMANYRGFLGSALFYAPNAPAGLILDYFTNSEGPVRITVADKAGNQVRQLNARAEARALNRVTWDMRYDPPVPPENTGGGRGGGGRGGGGRGGRGGGGAEGAAPAAAGTGELATEFGAEAAAAAGGGGGGGGRGFGGPARGSLVDPGSYVVTIAAAGKTDSRTFTVEEDPRVQFSDDDRAKRRKVLTTLAGLTRDADAARRKIVGINTALTNLTESWKLPNAPAVPDSVKKAAADLMEKVKPALAMFESPAGGGRGGGAGPGGPFVPPPVTQKIARLMQAIDGYTAAPTSRQMSDLAEATAHLQAGVVAVNSLWDEVPKFNKTMQDAGVPYFAVALGGPATGGGRGGN